MMHGTTNIKFIVTDTTVKQMPCSFRSS